MGAANGNGIGQALASAGDGAFVIGDDLRIRQWNPAAETLLGYTPREVIGRACCDVFNGYTTEGNRLCSRSCPIMTQARAKEPIRHFDMRARTKAGRPVWLNMSVLTTTNAAGEPLTIHLFRDVTAAKELLTLVHERLSEAPGTAPTLSRRELEVLLLMTQGLNTAGIAERLSLSRATVRNHAQSIFTRLGVHSRLEAVAVAARYRLF